MSHLTPYAGAGSLSPEVRRYPTSDSRDVWQIWTTIRNRWRTFLAVFVGFFTVIVVATILAPKTYTTTVRLMAGRPGSSDVRTGGDTALPVLNALVLQNGEQSAETFAQLAQQRDIAQKVIDAEKLQTTPEALLSEVSVKPVVNTSLLNLSVGARSADQSARVANAFANAFVDQEREFVRSQAVAALGYLATELPQAEARMRDTAARLANFQSTHGFVDAAQHEQDVIARIGSIDQKVDQLTVDQSEARSLLKNVQSQLAGTASTIDSARQVGPDPIEASLRAKLSDIEAQLSEAQAQYTSAHPTVIALQRERDMLRSKIAQLPSSAVTQTTLAPNPLYQSLQQQASTYQSRIDGDQAQLQTLHAQRVAAAPDMRAMPTAAMEFASIREDATRAANVYNALAQKNNDALVAKTTAISDIFVVQPAAPEAAVVSPNLLINAAIALVVGLLLGIGVVYILELIENRGSSEDVAQRLGLPVIARIPNINTSNLRALPWVQSMTIEAFLHLCVTLRLKNKKRLRTLAIVSPCRGDGKSTVSHNLAKAMSTLQTRVLLIDADLRRPSLHQKIGIPNETGLSEVLSGASSLEEAAQNVAPSLDILTSGSHVANPVVLLEGGLSELLHVAEEHYDMVIVDAPALAAVSDGLLIATHVDGTLLVVAADAIDEREAHHAVAQLTSLGIDNILGIVANKDKVRFDDYADYFANSHVSLKGGTA